MNKKRKIIFVIAIIVLIALAIALILSIGATKQKSNFTKQGNSWENDFIATLDKENYLCSDIIADFKDVNIKTLEEDGDTVFVISKFNNKGNDIHNIQYTVKDDILSYYHYKNYSFKTRDSKKIEKSDAQKIVNNFAKEFIPNGEKLKFENKEEKQVQSLYNKNKVETWYAKDSNGEYSIVIDLEKGSVIYYYMA